MRSLAEIAFRSKQEIANFSLWLTPPELPKHVRVASPLNVLPDPLAVIERCRGTEFECTVLELAHRAARHRFPVLGYEVDAGPEIHWRRDYVHGQETAQGYFRRIPYLSFERAGDHKVIWELNRHSHWILLAMAYASSGDRQWLEELEAQARDWRSQNALNAGINWTSALEVAFRALSWMWVWHLVGNALSAEGQDLFLQGIYRHAVHLRHNLSVYFSPNTHLLGEAVVLHALGKAFPAFPGASEWVSVADAIVAEHAQIKVRGDGSYYEQSSYYHVYALDMLQFHRVMGGTVSDAKLHAMASYLTALMGPCRVLPMMGDDDGGRFFLPYGERDRFGRATLATASCLLNDSFGGTEEDLLWQAVWWLGEANLPPREPVHRSCLFPDSGNVVMIAGENQVIVDAGPFGAGSGGHSHADTLNILVRRRSEEILIDPGTYTYVSDPEWRERFRGTGAHNTIRLNNMEQATPAGPFRWLHPPAARILVWTPSARIDLLDAECTYSGFRHIRRVRFLKPDIIFVLDDIRGGPGSHLVEQYWHLGSEQEESRLQTAGYGFREYIQGGEYGWRSRALGHKEQAVTIRVSYQGVLPVCLGAVLDLAEEARRDVLQMQANDNEIVLTYGTASSRFLVEA